MFTPPHSITVFIRSPDTYSERRYDPSLTLGALKVKLEHVTGIPSGAQVLTLSDGEGTQGNVIEGDERTLAQVGVKEWQCIQVSNINPHANPEGEYTDVSRVDKYEISNEEYEKRNDTVLQDLKSRGLGRFAPATTPTTEHRATPDQSVGKRCIVLHPGSAAAEGDEPRGTIEYIGQTAFGKGKGKAEEGDWIGVRLDEPVGKNDGSVERERYFTCKPNHGVFVRPERVAVGDWPEVDEFADVDDDGEDEI